MGTQHPDVRRAQHDRLVRRRSGGGQPERGRHRAVRTGFSLFGRGQGTSTRAGLPRTHVLVGGAAALVLVISLAGMLGDDRGGTLVAMGAPAPGGVTKPTADEEAPLRPPSEPAPAATAVALAVSGPATRQHETPREPPPRDAEPEQRADRPGRGYAEKAERDRARGPGRPPGRDGKHDGPAAATLGQRAGGGRPHGGGKASSGPPHGDDGKANGGGRAGGRGKN